MPTHSTKKSGYACLTLLFLTVVTLGTVQGTAQERPRPGNGPGPRNGQWKPWQVRAGRDAGRISSQAGGKGFDESPFKTEPIDKSWVFIEGEYLPPPYVVTSEGDLVSINGRAIREHSFDAALQFIHSDDEDEDRGRGRGRPGGRRLPATASIFGQRIAESLRAGRRLLLIWSDHPPIILTETGAGLEFLELLTSIPSDRTPETLDVVLSDIPESARSDVAMSISNFKPTEDFVQRAQAAISRVRKAEAANFHHAAALRRLESMNYPLSVVGMLLCTLAFGHLLRNQPGTDASSESSPKDRSFVYRSLGLAIAFSALDLTWTLLALDAGTMRETNPIAGAFAESPLGLAAFKSVLTLFAVGVIAKLWQHRTAQVASWWACLILALLTVRWLALNSMMA